MKSLIFFLTFFLLSFSITSCKKDDVRKPRKELLLGDWEVTSDIYNPAYDVYRDGILRTEIIETYSTCGSDDFITFNSGGQGAFDQGPTMCPNKPEQRSTFTWSLYNNDHTLVVAGESYSLLELTDKLLRIAYTFQDGPVTYTNTLTFTRK